MPSTEIMDEFVLNPVRKPFASLKESMVWIIPYDQRKRSSMRTDKLQRLILVTTSLVLFHRGQDLKQDPEETAVVT